MAVIDLGNYLHTVRETDPFRAYGRITDITGLTIKATGIDVSIGEACRIFSDSETSIDAEVVGFKDGKIILMATGEVSGIRHGSRVRPMGKKISVKVGDGLIGRVINATGDPIDGKGPVNESDYPLISSSQNPLKKQKISEPIDTGIRVMNGLLTCGKGQRLGIMAGSGVGKSVLLSMIAKYSEADINVIALIGERSREVREFVEMNLGGEGLKKSIVVVSTSEQAPLAKVRGAFAATAIAEYFRDQGKNVMLLMDSLTRVAMAQREIGLAIGEPPTTRGYTPSVFALLPRLLERVGTSENRGSITGLYTVLVEGDDMLEPVADMTRSILDGHIVLSRDLAMENHYPSIDVLNSISRVMPNIIDNKQREYAGRFVEVLSTYKKFEDMINLGAYKSGSNFKVDYSIKMIERLKNYMRQGTDELIDMADSQQGLYFVFDENEAKDVKDE
ncbi:MAG: FliI/YscN family ATPase [Nitrospiraceae bacterium]|nr:MAG: FliI/YscN family ATPase [Nitrospiraceae bacterium]